ncbi:autotransporter domain-containing protein [Labrys portucalensis]|uniref:Autotransporter domain-containing protein n=1 Tax=Labrys neptuniae TaxID=376174 RepID=A0ABV6ZSB3_9HYPH
MHIVILRDPKRTILSTIVVLSCIIGYAPASAKEKDDLRILTYNTWLDGNKIPLLDLNGSGVNPDQLRKFLSVGDYDILLLQELVPIFGKNTSQLKDVLNGTGNGSYDQNFGPDKGILSRLEGTMGLQDIGVGFVNTVMPYQRVAGQGSRPEVLVTPIHLNANDDPNDSNNSPSGTGSRLDNVRALNQWAKQQTMPIIAAGDFNAGDVSERGLLRKQTQEALLRKALRDKNQYYLNLVRQYATNKDALDKFIKNGNLDAPIPSDLFKDENYPVPDNTPRTLNVLKKQFMILQKESEREPFRPHPGPDDGSSTWANKGQDNTIAQWPSWDRVQIDHFTASRPFGKWWEVVDDPNNRYLGTLDTKTITTDDGKTFSDHNLVAHDLRWTGPKLETYEENGQKKTRLVWDKDAYHFQEKNTEFFLTRNNMRSDVYLGQVSDDNGIPILSWLTEEEKKTKLDCKSKDLRLAQTIRNYCIDDHSFIGQAKVSDGGTVIVDEDAALGGEKAKLILDNGSLRVDGKDMHILNREVRLDGLGGFLDIADPDNFVAVPKAVTGSGGLVKNGEGALYLTADNTYTGETKVNAGSLYIGLYAGGSLVSNVLVNQGALLGGTGKIGSLTVNSGGSVGPGNPLAPLGTLTVNGRLTFEDGSIYEADIRADGNGDKIIVTVGDSRALGDDGKAIIKNNVNVNVGLSALDPLTSYKDGQLYRILETQNGVTGMFAGANSKSAFLDFSVGTADGKNVDMEIKVKKLPPVKPGEDGKPASGRCQRVLDCYSNAQTQNQYNAAVSLGSLEQSGKALALYNGLLVLNAEEARGAFDQLSGEVHASIAGALVGQSAIVRNAANDRLRSVFGAVGARTMPVFRAGSDGLEEGKQPGLITTDGMALWGQTFDSWSVFGGNGNDAGLSVNVGGLMAGFDAPVHDNVRAGLLGGYSRSEFNVDRRNSSGNSGNYYLGLYGGGQWGAFSVRSGLSYTWHDIDTKRSVGFRGFSDTLRGRYHAGSLQAFGELGYRIDAASVSLEPFAGFAYVNLNNDDFSERGQSAAALRGGGESMNTAFSTLGARFSSYFTLLGIDTRANGTLGWRHAYGDVDPKGSFTFVGSGAFRVSGVPIARDLALVQAGLDFKVTETTTIGVNYSGEFGKKAATNSFDTSLKVRF